jgi:hypothetical protein
MTASERKKSPDFFEDHELDPVAAVAGSRSAGTALVPKKKAGFYLSENLLDRFNRCFHQLKLEGVAVDNKSALVERILSLALDDLEKGKMSQLVKMLK